MNRYLEIFDKIKESKAYQRWCPKIERVEAYIKGQITSEELVEDTDDLTREAIYSVINKIISYEEKPVRYYIKSLTEDMPCIIAGEVEHLEINYNRARTIGPRAQRNEWSSFRDDRYTEITGNFSFMINGTMLSYMTLIRIWEESLKKKFSLLDKLNALRKDLFGDWSGKEDIFPLSQEIIDSIQLVEQKEYLTKEEVNSGYFGTFEEIVTREQTPVKQLKR